MKKRFVEPALHRIELNLRENIAASAGGGESTSGFGYYFMQSLFSCTIVTTGKYLQREPFVTEKEAEICLTVNNTRTLLYFYPREVVLPYFRS